MKTLKYMLFGLFLVCSMPSKAALITITPSNTEVYVGELLTFQIQLSDLAPGEVLALFDLKLLIDENIFSLQSVLFGNALGGTENSDQYIYDLNFFENSYLTDFDLSVIQSTSFTLLSLNLKALIPAMDTLVSLSVNPFGLLNYEFLDIDAEIRSTSVSVLARPTSVPEPRTLSILTLVCTALFFANRRSRKVP